MNLHYVPKNEEDLKAYQEDIKNRGFRNSFEFIEGRYKGMYPDEVKRIKDSWSGVFDIERWNVFDVQANIWHIKKEWVKCIIKPGEQIPKEYIMD